MIKATCALYSLNFGSVHFNLTLILDLYVYMASRLGNISTVCFDPNSQYLEL